jgi:hypothetical protein
MKNICEKTCGHCETTTMAPTTLVTTEPVVTPPMTTITRVPPLVSTTTTAPQSSCSNTVGYDVMCETMKRGAQYAEQDQVYKKFIEENCQKTFVFCTVESVVVAAECASMNGTVDPNSDLCYVLYPGQETWNTAWSLCRSKTVGGRQGLLVQPKTRSQVAAMAAYLDTHNPTNISDIHIGCRTQSPTAWGPFYYPAAADTVVIDPSFDQRLPPNQGSEPWHDGQPNDGAGLKQSVVRGLVF